MDVRFSDGTDVYSLTDDGVSVTSYAPKVEDRAKESVSDSLEIVLKSDTLADQQTKKDTINYWLALAREQWRTVNDSHIYLEIKQTGESDWRRSEMMGGRLQPMAGTLDSHSQKVQQYLLIVDRRNWWEWPEEELPLSLDNATFATGGVTVDNTGTPIFIQAEDVLGDPQTSIPCRIEITPADTNQYIDRIYISHNVFANLNPLTPQHLIFATDATAPLPLDDGTDTDGTAYVRMWQTGASTEQLEIPISSAKLGALGGRWYRLLGRIKTEDATESVFGQIYLYAQGHTSENVMAATEWTLIATDPTAGYDLIDFGAMRLPTLMTSYAASALEFYVRARSADAFEVRLDFIQLSPVDSFHHVASTNTSALNPELIVADGRINRTYMLAVDESVDAFSDVSEHLSLWAGRDQWLTILHRNAANLMERDQELDVRIYYRPRRVTV